MARTRIKVGVIPKFPAQVVAGDGISIDQTGGVFTFSIDPDTAPDVLGLEIGVDVQAYDDDGRFEGLQHIQGLSAEGRARTSTRERRGLLHDDATDELHGARGIRRS